MINIILKEIMENLKKGVPTLIQVAPGEGTATKVELEEKVMEPLLEILSDANQFEMAPFRSAPASSPFFLLECPVNQAIYQVEIIRNFIRIEDTCLFYNGRSLEELFLNIIRKKKNSGEAAEMRLATA